MRLSSRMVDIACRGSSHQGNAGIIACNLRYGYSTSAVPFFDDQLLRGAMIVEAGAGLQPIQHRLLDCNDRTIAIRFCLTSKAGNAAMGMSRQISREHVVMTAASSSMGSLTMRSMSRDLLPHLSTVWSSKSPTGRAKLSQVVRQLLVKHSRIRVVKLDIHRTKKIRIQNRRWAAGAASFDLPSMPWSVLA